MSKEPTTPRQLNDRFRLRRACLGLVTGAGGEVYVGDAETGRVYMFGAKAFGDAIRSGRIRARRWCVGMSRGDCLVKYISLPAADEQEARQMIEYELPGLVPSQAENICYGVWRTGAGDADVLRYGVFLSPQSRVEKATAALVEAGVIPDRVVPDSVGLWRWLRLHVGTDASGLFIAIEAEGYHWLALDAGELQVARSASQPPETAVDVVTLLAQVKQAVTALGFPMPAETSPRLFLSGRADLVELISVQACGDGGGEVQTPSSCVAVPSAPEIWSDPDLSPPTSGISARCALGCALEAQRAGGHAINLIPSVWQEQRTRRERRRQGAITAGLVAMVPLLAYLWLAVRVGGLEHRRMYLERQMSPIREIATALEKKKEQSRLIQAQISNRELPLELLAELYRRVPEGLSLSQLEIEMKSADPKLTLKGSAASLESAFAFPSILEQSPLLSDVRPEAAQQVSRGDGTLIEFGCRCRIDRAFQRGVR